MIRSGLKGGLEHVDTAAAQTGGLIGSRWNRREPLDDAYDEVVITGLFDVGETLELVYAPLSFGENLTAAVELFVDVYSRSDTADSRNQLRQLHDRLARVIASAG